jgi:hypothetical protein
VYQVRSTFRSSTTTDRAATAVDALRIFREAQAKPFLRACAVLRRGVIMSQDELEKAARGESA